MSSSQPQDHPYQAPSARVIPIIITTPATPSPRPTAVSVMSRTFTASSRSTTKSAAATPNGEPELEQKPELESEPKTGVESPPDDTPTSSRATTAVGTATATPARIPSPGSGGNGNVYSWGPRKLRRALAAVRPTTREAVLLVCWAAGVAAFVGSAAGVAVVAAEQGRPDEPGTDHKPGWTRQSLTATGVCCAAVHGAATLLFTAAVATGARQRQRLGQGHRRLSNAYSGSDLGMARTGTAMMTGSRAARAAAAAPWIGALTGALAAAVVLLLVDDLRHWGGQNWAYVWLLVNAAWLSCLAIECVTGFWFHAVDALARCFGPVARRRRGGDRHHEWFGSS